jgi:hypothetical protein
MFANLPFCSRTLCLAGTPWIMGGESCDADARREHKGHLADPQLRYVIPLCQESAWYPERHSRGMVAINQLPGSGFCDRCSSCDVASRRERRYAR